MAVDIKLIKELREMTQAGVLACREALQDSGGDIKKAVELLRKQGITKAAGKAGRPAHEGIVESYIHVNGKVGAIVELHCETDFVAKNPAFKNLAHEIAMQVASMDPESVDVLLKEQYIRDTSRTIDDLVKEHNAKFGEHIEVERFIRFSIGG